MSETQTEIHVAATPHEAHMLASKLLAPYQDRGWFAIADVHGCEVILRTKRPDWVSDDIRY